MLERAVGGEACQYAQATRGQSAILEGTAGVERPPIPPEPEKAGVTVRLHGDGLSGSWIFAGLFPGGVPQRRPVAGMLLDAPGVYRLGPVLDGSYHLMAAALPRSKDPPGLTAIRPHPKGRSRQRATTADVRRGVAGVAELEVRPSRTTDPPVLLALPALLPELLATPGSP
jgi:AraC family transcriptional regulator